MGAKHVLSRVDLAMLRSHILSSISVLGILCSLQNPKKTLHVMAALEAAIQRKKHRSFNKIWMAGSSPAMTWVVFSGPEVNTVYLRSVAPRHIPAYRGELIMRSHRT